MKLRTEQNPLDDRFLGNLTGEILLIRGNRGSGTKSGGGGMHTCDGSVTLSVTTSSLVYLMKRWCSSSSCIFHIRSRLSWSKNWKNLTEQLGSEPNKPETHSTKKNQLRTGALWIGVVTSSWRWRCRPARLAATGTPAACASGSWWFCLCRGAGSQSGFPPELLRKPPTASAGRLRNRSARLSSRPETSRQVSPEDRRRDRRQQVNVCLNIYKNIKCFV